MREKDWPPSGLWWRWTVGLILAFVVPLAVPIGGVLWLAPGLLTPGLLTGVIFYLLPIIAGILGVRLLPIEPGLNGCALVLYVPTVVFTVLGSAVLTSCFSTGNCL